MRVFKIGFLLAVIFLSASCIRQAEKKNGFNLVWEENFEDSTKLEKKWTKVPRGKSDWNKYMSNYDGLFKIKNGNLILKGIKNTVLPEDDSPYLTGGVYTKDKMHFSSHRHGRIEVRAKLFGTRSAWPSIFLLPKDGKWPDGGEIDMMQRINSDNYIYQTIHSSYTVTEGIKDDPKSVIVAFIKPDNYNVYAVELFPDSVSFFINDTHTFTYPRIETDISGQFPFADEEFYLLIDMQLGGKWAGIVNEQDLPTEMHIDWVRYFEKEI